MSQLELTWLIIGFAGQAVFTARFIVQWIASERRGESVIPVSFWYMSLIGSWMILAYAIYRRDPVIIAGQAFGVIVYGRNLALIYKKSWQQKQAELAYADAGPSVAAEPDTDYNLKIDHLESGRRQSA